jgi:branched-chain amino acid transport system ATP-binding protein
MLDVAALVLKDLTKTFGASAAIDGLSLSLAAGETLGVIGPNGAGKSTLVNLVSGALKPTRGDILLFGQSIAARPPEARTRLGVGRTYQIPRPFGRMTVRENLALAARNSGGARAVHEVRQACDAILKRTGLSDVADTEAAALPLLRRKRLELARAMALRPRLLLLDEIGAGLVETEGHALIELIHEIRRDGVSIVLIEHVMPIVSACCDRTAVLDVGRLVIDGPTREVLRDAATTAVYLGSAGVAAPPAPERKAAPKTEGPLLRVRDVHVRYVGVRALRGVDLDVGAGEVVALLGANGAGKTTLANAISGAVSLDAGQIDFAGARIDTQTPQAIAAAGLAHCREGRKIFASLSVEENLSLAAGRAPKSERTRRLASLFEIFPDLAQRRREPGTRMSGGQQQMLAIARALMSDPKLVIFDEISLGLAPRAIERLYVALAAIKQSGVAMLLIEQNIERGLQFADRAYVLTHGRIGLSGDPETVRTHPSLRALYVGES